MANGDRIKVKINQGDKNSIIYVDKGENLLEVLRKNDFFIDSPCGGKGNCGKCKVLVGKLAENHAHKEVKLACQTNIFEDMEVVLNSKSDKVEIMTNVDIKTNDTNLLVEKICLEIDPPSIEDQRDDITRITNSLNRDNLSLDYEMLKEIADKIREYDFNITITLYKDKLIDIEPKDKVKDNYGIAIDMGTTTIACYLIDLKNGKIIDVESAINKQRVYGADVISRINFTLENKDGIKILKDTSIEQINNIINILCERNKISSRNIYNLVIVGNTVMTHMILGLPTKNIASSPFVPVITKEVEIKGKELGINICGYVNIVPNISSYIGSDVLAGIYASGMANSEKYSLFLDIGTNGELALGNKDGIITCSTAAGPAFEGANIKCGVGGISGAINKIDLSQDKIYETIEDKTPVGICGSGVIDMVSELLKYNIIDETGRILDKDEILDFKMIDRIEESDENEKQFLLEKDGIDGNRIVFTQKDIREVQLAKAAIASGIKVIMNEANVKYEDIDKLYIGGGFGNYMDIEKSINIGLIPKELKEKIVLIGNSAGSGAISYLISKENRERIKDIVKNISYIELSSKKDFQYYYIDEISF